MKTTTIVVLLACVFALVSLQAVGQQQQQQPTGPPVRPSVVHGTVRLPDGRPAPQGMLVTLEYEGGGTAAQTQTDPGGRFEFTQGIQPALMVVRVTQPGYQPVSELVDLRVMQNAYVNLEVHPLPPSEGGVLPPGGPGAMISVQAANVPEAARKELARGKELLIKGEDLDQSIGHFKKAIEQYPSYAEAYVLMGLAYSTEQRWNDASSALQKAIQLDANSAPAYTALGGLRNLQKKYGEAEKPLSKAVQLDPESADAQFELARAYWGLGRWQDADPHAAKAVQLKPDNAAAHVLMGNILLRKRDAPGALKEFKESLRLEPKGPLAEPAKQMVEKIENAMKSSKPSQAPVKR